MFKKLAQMGIQKLIQATPRSQKVGPTITSVKPNFKKTAKETKDDEYTKRIKKLDSAEGKIITGKKMIKEGQKERKNLEETGRAFQFKNLKGYHPLSPGDKAKYGKKMKVPGPQKKFLKGKELEKKAKGGRIGLKKGTDLPKKKSNVNKIKKTFGTLSVRAGIDKNPNPTYADKIAGAKMKNKNKKKVI